jgi:GT2 family glycosyltransferase
MPAHEQSRNEAFATDVQAHRLQLAPLPTGSERPLWSVIIPTHNCASYLESTLASVLAQAPAAEEMQIEVIDDHSEKDDPEAVVRRLGQGRVGFFRQPKNVGHIGNFETGLQRSRGRLLHILHGDDQVLPGFYARMSQVFESNPAIGAAFCRVVFIDERGEWNGLQEPESSASGVLPDLFERLLTMQRLQTPSMVVRREVYEKLGGFDRRLSWTEDWEMWSRISRAYPVWFEKSVLALYRIHSSSNSGRYKQTAENVRDLARLFGILEDACQTPDQRRLAKVGRLNCAKGAIRHSAAFFAGGNLPAARNQLKAALRLAPSPRLVPILAKAYGRALLSSSRRTSR